MGCGASADEIIDPSHTNISHFSLERVVGQGGFGKVSACTHKMSGKWFAIKTLSKETVIKTQNCSMLLNERNLLADLRSKFIVNMFFAFQDEYNCYLVMDLCLGGDLRYQLVHHPKPGFSEDQSKFYIASILKALEYIHGLQIIHRDIKPDSNGYAKLTDFGISQKLNADGFCYAGSGTRAYMALEILRSGRKHNGCADFYALGVVLFEFLTGTWPYKTSPSTCTSGSSQQNMDPKETVSKIDGISEDCKDFLTQLLIQDYHHRLGYKKGVIELIRHKWFETFDWVGFENNTMEAAFIPNTKRANCDTGKEDLIEAFGGKDISEKPKISEENQQLFNGYNYNTEIKLDDTGKPIFDYN